MPDEHTNPKPAGDEPSFDRGEGKASFDSLLDEIGEGEGHAPDGDPRPRTCNRAGETSLMSKCRRWPVRSDAAMSKPITCPKGHPGPFRYVEAIEVWREVTSANSQRIRIHGEWRTGEGFNEGLPGSDYLLCRAPVGEGICGEEFPIPDGVELEFE